ncbi:OmpA family protein [Tabrizicola sp. BL-A-41-H6]|uniref:OmpA family protein n=1 Tax=Tabrizicola sp. BL-A-41-H6 TaxID=3421107 RepID=UPI003D67BDA6
MTGMFSKLFATSAILALAACGNSWDTEVGSGVDKGDFGNATMNNTLIQSGQLEYTVALAERFSAEVPDTINFAFNSAQLTEEARGILRTQANFIKQFPEVRFRVFGHTDLVGSASYNQRLGLRRAQAAVAYLTSLGISKSRVEAVVSYGKTRPIIQTSAPEERNRRTVTEVSGFVESAPLILNGKYAEVIWREYVGSAVRPHPTNVVIETQVTGGE